ncbi:tRNA lysidine(34) synthetase TilS [uncultured Methylophaga sp.]|uniref:tRNA lysidine(34) synthetase TilS n=1 Tax=uncultured Methylophaga sp. TaxID=285271 RepID=UPI002616F24C|nr:tRNA lysidine(34) synthetase TilS [uncultured Methylophaga sp.]
MASSHKALNPQQFIVDLIRQVDDRAVCVAYSGGVDSHVLLHLLATTHHPQLPAIRALHIDHGLHPDSSRWAVQCRQTAADLGVSFESVSVSVDSVDELGLEAAAREARYHAFRFDLADNEVLLTAQHQQDQAETLLLQLLRGAGPAGLSAMAEESDNQGLTVIRPFLGISKTDIVSYAKLHKLQWIDDPSNDDQTLNRNYLRHAIWPLLEQRWPGMATTLSRSADHCREAVVLMRGLAQLDAGQVLLTDSDGLSISALTQLPEARQRNLLRYAIETAELPLPSAAILQRVLEEVCLAAEDKNPHVEWPGGLVRRYRDQLFIESAETDRTDLGETLINGTETMTLGDGRRLHWRLSSGQGLKPHVLNSQIMLKFRQGGERIRLQGHAQHKSLKQLFQEWGVPPWQRTQIPLLFVGQELIAVVGYGYAEHYAADIGEKGWLPLLEQP